MGRETELDDLELEQLLEDDDFLDDFDVDELAAELLVDDEPSSEVAAAGVDGGREPSPEADSGAAAVAAPETDDSPAGAGKPKLQFVLLTVTVAVLLLLQLYLAGKIVTRRPVICSRVQKLAAPVLAGEDFSQKVARPAPTPPPAANSGNVTTLSFFYPLYSLQGLQVLGVDIRLVFSPASGTFALSRSQAARLQEAVVKALDRHLAGRLLEEIPGPKAVFSRLIKQVVAQVLQQWQCPPVAVSLQNLVIK